MALEDETDRHQLKDTHGRTFVSTTSNENLRLDIKLSAKFRFVMGFQGFAEAETTLRMGVVVGRY